MWSDRRKKGFSLVEVAASTAFIGLGIAALMAALNSGTQMNDAGQEITQATYLAQEIREWAMRLPFHDPDNPTTLLGVDTGENQQNAATIDDVKDLHGAVYNPPRNAKGDPINSLTGWEQHISVQYRLATKLTDEDTTKTSDVVYVTVDIYHVGNKVFSTGFLVAARPGQ